jgi:hypothetical protein
VYKYKLKSIRVIEELQQFDGFLAHQSSHEDRRIRSRMDEGDRFRKLTDRCDALALLSIFAVICSPTFA